MSAYIIALIEIHYRDEYKKYQEAFGRSFHNMMARSSLLKKRQPSLKGSGHTHVRW
jgi:hypothetical protein